MDEIVAPNCRGKGKLKFLKSLWPIPPSRVLKERGCGQISLARALLRGLVSHRKELPQNQPNLAHLCFSHSFDDAGEGTPSTPTAHSATNDHKYRE